jgi:hypothetical protein
MTAFTRALYYPRRRPGRARPESLGFQSAYDIVWMGVEFRSDGSDFPMLDIEKSERLSAESHLMYLYPSSRPFKCQLALYHAPHFNVVITEKELEYCCSDTDKTGQSPVGVS